MNRIPDIDREIAMMDERFTLKLHRILEDAEEQGFSHIIQWDPGGRSFTIHQPEVFSKTIMQNYFRQTKYKSFQRQLNLYDFRRETRNGVRGVYSHPLFVKHDRLLCQQIKRKSQAPALLIPRAQREELAHTSPGTSNILNRFDTSSAIEDSKVSKDPNRHTLHSSETRDQKADADDESIETIDGFVDDIDAGELFKTSKSRNKKIS